LEEQRSHRLRRMIIILAPKYKAHHRAGVVGAIAMNESD